MHNMELVQKTKIYYGSQSHKNCSDQNFLKEKFDNDDFSERRQKLDNVRFHKKRRWVSPFYPKVFNTFRAYLDLDS